MPTQNHRAHGKKITEWLKMKVSQITLRWAGLKVQNGSKNLAMVTEGWGMLSKRKCEWSKTTNKEQQQNEDDNQHHKKLRANTIAGSFWL